jgi:hypothetical protein
VTRQSRRLTSEVVYIVEIRRHERGEIVKRLREMAEVIGPDPIAGTARTLEFAATAIAIEGGLEPREALDRFRNDAAPGSQD